MEKMTRPAVFQASQAERYAPFFVTLISLFALSILIPKGSDVLFINGHHTRLTDLFFKTITNLGDGVIFVPIVIATLFIRYRYTVMAVILSIAHGLLVSIFKRVMFHGAVRPRKFLGDHLIHFADGVHVHSINSFPSGHTATAFCAALFLALLIGNRTYTFLLLVLAMLVAYSRIYLAQHFLLDVAAGAIIGAFTTFMTWEIFGTSHLPIWMNGRLKPVSRRKRQVSLR